jgi:hypothetical protein
MAKDASAPIGRRGLLKALFLGSLGFALTPLPNSEAFAAEKGKGKGKNKRQAKGKTKAKNKAKNKGKVRKGKGARGKIG